MREAVVGSEDVATDDKCEGDECETIVWEEKKGVIDRETFKSKSDE